MRIRAHRVIVAAWGMTAFAGAAFGQAVGETEPNSLKSAANAAVFTTIADGEIGTITGSSTGFLTGASNAAANSADYYLVTLPSAAPGIYRYQFQLTSTTSGYSANLRGFSQSAGVINTSSDQTLQTTTTATNPPRSSVVYGFGGAEQVYYRVSGTSATTSAYVSTLTRTTVTPTAAPGTFRPGDITVSTLFRTAHDTSFIVLDSNFQPVTANDPATMTPMAFRNDNENVPPLSGGSLQSVCTRTLAPGTYYIAIADVVNGTMNNNQASPADDRTRNQGVLDFPGTMYSSSVQTGMSLGVSIGDGCQAAKVAITKPNAYDIMFVQFTVGSADAPCAALSTSVNPATQGQVVDFYANVTPAPAGATAITSVVADLSEFGGGSAMVMSNDGVSNGDAAVDGVWTARLAIPTYRAGRAPWRATATDADGRTASNEAVLTMTTSAPPNDTCATAVAIASLPYQGVFGNFLATTDADVSCNSLNNGSIQGVWFTHTPATSHTLVLSETSAQDVIHVVYDATGGCDALGAPVLCTVTDENAVVGVNAGTPYAILTARFASTATTIQTDNYAVRFESQAIAPPVNDTCATATAITTLPFAELVSNAGAGDDLDVSCNDVQYPLTRNGVWYTYTPATTCYLNFAETTAQDVVFGFFSGACDGLAPVECDVIESGKNALLRGGTRYFILVGRHSTTVAAGATEQIGVSFTACTPPPAAPPNDQCSGATAIGATPYADAPLAAGATTDAVAPSCSIGAMDSPYGVWYTHTPTADGTGVIAEVGPENVHVSVWTGACGALTEVACFTDDVGTLNQFPMTAGAAYFMLVSNAGVPAGPASAYEIQFRVIAASANQDCPGAPLALGVGVSGTTADATIGTLTSACSSSVKDLWWSFTAPFGDTFGFSCEKLSGGRATVSLHSACSPGSEVNCLSGLAGTVPHTVTVYQPMATGETLHVRVSAVLDSDGPFNLIVSASAPLGACCYEGGPTCILTTAANCDAQDYHGDSSTCAPGLCAPAMVSCCRGTTCNAVAAASCTGQVAGSNAQVTASCGAGAAFASCCYADFNHDGAQSIDDLFLYINAYFTTSPMADFGGDGTSQPTIDDLFLYINAYFGTCQ